MLTVFMRAPKSIRNTTALFKHMSFLMIPDAHELANGVGQALSFYGRTELSISFVRRYILSKHIVSQRRDDGWVDNIRRLSALSLTSN
jgi:hypothetical protein